MIKDQTRKRGRHWTRISLRRLMILFIVLCVVFGWYFSRVYNQTQVVKWAKDNGAQVFYSFDMDAKGMPVANGQPDVPQWLIKLFGVDYFFDVQAIEVAGDHVKTLRPLTNIPKLEQLGLWKTRPLDLGCLAEIKGLTQLKMGDIDYTDLKSLPVLPGLHTLWIGPSQITDLKPLKNVENIKSLVIIGSPVSDLTPLSDLVKLETVTLASTTVVELSPLADLANLIFLACPETDDKRETVRKLKQTNPDLTVIPMG